MPDDTDALGQVATAVEQSDLTDEDVEERRVLLGKLEDELGVYTDLGEVFRAVSDAQDRVCAQGWGRVFEASAANGARRVPAAHGRKDPLTR
jgi:hypothetical protein